jgi:hypothetical protein
LNIRATNDDEMCNFYIMYYVKGTKTLTGNVCYTPGPPFWYFKDFESDSSQKLDLSAIPKDISEVPEAKEEEMMPNHMNMGTEKSKEASSSEMNASSSESSEENLSYAVPDEYENSLNDLEKELYYKNIIKNYMANKNNRRK